MDPTQYLKTRARARPAAGQGGDVVVTQPAAERIGANAFGLAASSRLFDLSGHLGAAIFNARVDRARDSVRTEQRPVRSGTLSSCDRGCAVEGG